MRQLKSEKTKGTVSVPSAPITEEPLPLRLDETATPARNGHSPAPAPATDATGDDAMATVAATDEDIKVASDKAEKTRKTDKADKADKARKTASDKAEKSEKRAADTVARVKAETKADERATAEVAAMFKALGDPTRLRILRYLRAERDTGASGDNGVVVGDVALHLACLAGTPARKATSTLSHHLKELRHAGLVTMERRGKNVVCAISPEAVERLQQVLKADAPVPAVSSGGATAAT